MRVHSQAWSAAAIVIVLLGVAAPSSIGTSGLPVVLSGSMQGGGYVAVKLDYEATGAVKLELSSIGCESGCVMGATFIDPDGSEFSSVATLRGIAGKGDCVILRSPTAGDIASACTESPVQHAWFSAREQVGLSHGVSVTGTISPDLGDPAGAWTMLVWIGFRPNQQAPTSWTLSFAAEDASILGVATGDRAWYASTSDFRDGTAAGVSWAGGFVSVDDGSRLALDVQDRLMGLMKTDSFGLSTPAGGMVFHGPRGAETCSCFLWNATGTGMVGRGSYDLTLTRVAAGHQGWTDVEVALVDPQLPG